MGGYLSFLAFAVVLVLIPGPDFAVVTRNTLAAGRRRGSWSAVGVATSNTVQGIAAATGLGTLIVRSQPVFEAVKWAGVGYLAYLGIQSLHAARAGRYPGLAGTGAARPGQAVTGWRQGFVSNITNPKVLVFYLAVLPQFLGPHAPVPLLILFAVSHAVLSLAYLLILVAGMHRVRRVLSRRAVRRALDTATGTLLLAFGLRMAVEQG